MYIDGRYSKKHFCLRCSKPISYCCWKYGSQLCISCSKKGDRNPAKREDVRYKISKNHADFSGKRNPSYIHGENNFPYSMVFTKKLKEQIRRRDNYQCQLCNKKERHLKGHHKKLDIHHINYNKMNSKGYNLITLCKHCNSTVNFERAYWYNHFMIIQEKRYNHKFLKNYKEEVK